MALLLAHALLSNPLACVCFWLFGVVLGSLTRWYQWPVASASSLPPSDTHIATHKCPKPGVGAATDITFSPPTSSAVSEAGDSTSTTATSQPVPGATRSPAVSPPRTPPPGTLRPRRSAAPQDHPHAALPAPRHPWYVHEREAREVVARVVAQDRGEEAGWTHMMDKQVTHKYTYSAYRRPLPGGVTEYRTVTTFADTTPIELMEFLLDDSARKQWEGFLTSVDVLLTGDWLGGREQVVRWVRRFPFHFLSDREYVLARKAWVVHAGGDPCTGSSEAAELLPLTTLTPGAPLVAVTKGLNTHPAAPLDSALVRTLDFDSSWVCRAGPDPWGRPCMAAQVVLLHSEAIQIPEYLARTAVSMGMTKFVRDLASGLEAFRAQRRAEGVPPHSLDLEAYGHDHVSDTLARAEHHTVDTLTQPQAQLALAADLQREWVAAAPASSEGSGATGVAVVAATEAPAPGTPPPPGWHMTAKTRAASGDVGRAGFFLGHAASGSDPYRASGGSRWKRRARALLLLAVAGAVAARMGQRARRGGSGGTRCSRGQRVEDEAAELPVHGRRGLAAHALTDVSDQEQEEEQEEEEEEEEEEVDSAGPRGGLIFTVRGGGQRDAAPQAGKAAWW